MTTTTRTTELATIVTGLRACKTRQVIGLIYQGMVGYNLADDDTAASLEDLRRVALGYVREVCAAEGVRCADVGLLRDISEWTIVDRRTDTSVEPEVLFADAQWVDSNADDYRADMLTGERSIDDSDTYIYEQTLDGCVAYVARGQGVHEIVLTDAPIKWRDLLTGWDTGDSTFEELLASFGLDATSALDEADEAFDGECKIWIEFNFYAGTLGDTRDRYWSDPETGDCTPTVFKSFADAQAWVEETEGSRYYLSHGEAGRPSYTICKA